jgi:A/G-specific adenine glycosylase
MVDTNIRRVLSRLVLGYDEPSAAAVQHVADGVLPAADAYAWNQALMDIGATLCRPARPLCLACPLLDVCQARVAPRPRQPAGAAPAPRGARFEDTDRYARGRIISLLRALPPGAALTRQAIRASLPDRAPEHLDRLLSQLARDGLLDLGQAGISLPDR